MNTLINYSWEVNENLQMKMDIVCNILLHSNIRYTINSDIIMKIFLCVFFSDSSFLTHFDGKKMLMTKTLNCIQHSRKFYELCSWNLINVITIFLYACPFQLLSLLFINDFHAHKVLKKVWKCYTIWIAAFQTLCKIISLNDHCSFLVVRCRRIFLF